MIAQKGVDAVTLRDVNENVGDKDMTVQARNVWQELCSGHIANKRTRKQTRAEHTKHLYSQVASFGDNDLVLSGLFENINNLRLGDTSMVKSARALNSMVDADVFIGAGFKKGHFHLQPYVASAAMGVHACVSNAPAASNLEWPQLGKMHREAVQQAPGRVVRYHPRRDGALPPHRHLPRDSARLRQLPQARGGAAHA